MFIFLQETILKYLGLHFDIQNKHSQIWDMNNADKMMLLICGLNA